MGFAVGAAQCKCQCRYQYPSPDYYYHLQIPTKYRQILKLFSNLPFFTTATRYVEKLKLELLPTGITYHSHFVHKWKRKWIGFFSGLLPCRNLTHATKQRWDLTTVSLKFPLQSEDEENIMIQKAETHLAVDFS